MSDQRKPAAIDSETVVITRQALADGSLVAAVRRRALPGTRLRSDAELEASLDGALLEQGSRGDVWVFGYGSLMWNPAFEYAEQRIGLLAGWRRRFCLWMYTGRGTPERPGLMLALDRGGSCRGIAFRIPAAFAREELLLVWRREMLSGAYKARWVNVRTDKGRLRAVTFIVNRDHERYAGTLPDSEVARYIATGAGVLGSCAHYLQRTTESLQQMKIRDSGLERIRVHLEDGA